MTLAAAAAVTERIRLMTDILLIGTREPVLLAKQAATLDQLSHGRFVLGVGSGARPDDFAVTGGDFKARGKRIDSMLEVMHRAWRGEPVHGTSEPVTPRPIKGSAVPMVFGGRSAAAVARVAKYGTGYTLGGGTPEALAEMIAQVDAAWSGAERKGKPYYHALTYFALGDEVKAEAESNVMAYYGADYGPRVWSGAVKSAEEAVSRRLAFEAVGCDELIFFMTAPHIEQAERLAQSLL